MFGFPLAANEGLLLAIEAFDLIGTYTTCVTFQGLHPGVPTTAFTRECQPQKKTIGGALKDAFHDWHCFVFWEGVEYHYIIWIFFITSWINNSGLWTGMLLNPSLSCLIAFPHTSSYSSPPHSYIFTATLVSHLHSYNKFSHCFHITP